MSNFLSDYLTGNTIPQQYRSVLPQLDVDPETRAWENARQRAGAYTFGELPPVIPEYSSDVSSGYIPYPQEAALAAAEQQLFTPDSLGTSESEPVRTVTPSTTKTATKTTTRTPNVVYENGKALPKEKAPSFDFANFLQENPYAALSALALLLGGGALALRR